MPDKFETQAASLTSPAAEGQLITPSDSAPLDQATRAIYVGQTGNLRAVMLSGATVTFEAVQAGTIYPLRLRQILATGTTAGGLVGLS